jgi:homoserine kinase
MKGPRPPLRSQAREGTLDAAIRVRVPATSANLGPAFDCAGLALALHDHLDIEVTDGGLAVEISGVGAAELPTDDSHLVVRAFRAACDELGWRPPGLRLTARNAIPQGRGLGSSAAAVVAGVMAAWALCPDVETVDLDAVLRLTTELEGHPDNVGACIHGALTLTWSSSDRGPHATRLDVHPEVLPVVLVPGTTLSTHVARGLLPAVVPHTDAAANAGRAALLVHALTSDPCLLLDATEDRLHQRQRGPAMPDTLALLDRLRAAGHAATVSGAGPSLLVLTVRHPDDPQDPASAVRAGGVAELVPPGWQVLPLRVDRSGVRFEMPRPRVSSA